RAPVEDHVAEALGLEIRAVHEAVEILRSEPVAAAERRGGGARGRHRAHILPCLPDRGQPGLRPMGRAVSVEAARCAGGPSRLRSHGAFARLRHEMRSVMDRRAFIGTLAGSLLAAPLGVDAQGAAKAPRIGYLVLGSLESAETRTSLDAFRQGLRERGYVEGQNIVIEYRAAD